MIFTYLFFRSQSDQQLQQQFRQGKGSAFTLLVERHSAVLLAYAGRYAYGEGSQQAEDLVNRALQRMADRIENGLVVDNVPAYMKRSITNLHISDLRRHKIKTIELNELVAGQLVGNNPDNEEDKTEQLLQIVQRELEFMRDDQRHIVIARDFERLSFERIAENLRQDIEKVKNIYYNAVKTLRRRADQMYDDFLTTS